MRVAPVWHAVVRVVFLSAVIVSAVLLLLTSSAHCSYRKAEAEFPPLSMEGIEEAGLAFRSLLWARANVRSRVWFCWQLCAELVVESRASGRGGAVEEMNLRSPCILKSQHHDDIDRALQCSRSCGVCPQFQAQAVELLKKNAVAFAVARQQ